MTQARRWLELRVAAHAEAVEAVSEILTRVGHQGIARVAGGHASGSQLMG